MRGGSRQDAIRWALASLPFASLAGIAYFLFEWLFLTTMPSPTASLSFAERVAVLFSSPLPFFPALLGAQLAASAVSLAGFPRLRAAAVVPAAAISGLLLFVLVDNFTYTLFRFGVLTAPDASRFVYAVLLLALAVVAGRQLLRALSALARRRTGPRAAAALALVLGAAGFPALRSPHPAPAPVLPGGVSSGSRVTAGHPASGIAGRPWQNVLLIGIDGVDAENLSAYGYQRETSPFLDSLRPETLFFENAFCNAGHTHGSLVSLLTGRLSFSTRVTIPPTILHGEDTRKNLPAILSGFGYTTLQVGLRHYADALDANLLGFDETNGRGRERPRVHGTEAAGDEAGVFRRAVRERLEERLRRISGLSPRSDAFAHVTGREESPSLRDDRRIETVLGYFRGTPEPWLIHAHLLDTHPPSFHPRRMHFSDGPAARDSQLRETDADLRTLFDGLRARGLLERTVVVVYSDHTSRWRTVGRLPLLIRFPGGPSGRVFTNVQLADVGPTILAWLGQPIPAWMDGVSLLDPGRLDPRRRIFAADIPPLAEQRIDAPHMPLSHLRAHAPALFGQTGAPNFGVLFATMIEGDRFAAVCMLTGETTFGTVPGHAGPSAAPISDEEAHAGILAKLSSAGFGLVTPPWKGRFPFDPASERGRR